MDDWNFLLQVGVGAAGALIFLKFVADGLEEVGDRVRALESREKRRWERQSEVECDVDEIITVQKIG